MGPTRCIANRLRQLGSIAMTADVHIHDARGFVQHVIMERRDVDPSLLELQHDRLDLSFRKDWLRRTWLGRSGGEANRYRADLISWYGNEEKGKAVKYAESFEICEYGRQPNREELKKLFPFF